MIISGLARIPSKWFSLPNPVYAGYMLPER